MILYVNPLIVFPKGDGRIHYAWWQREWYSWIWNDWVNFLPWRLRVLLWNFLFRQNVNWRKYGTWWRGKKC